MRKSTKQNILTAVIVIAIIALIGTIVYVMYEEKIKASNSNAQNISSSTGKTNSTTNNTIKEEDKSQVEDDVEQESEEEYIGKEEEETTKEEDTQISKDDKAIQLAKEKWGEDDSVTFNIEEKKENIYYVAVKSNATVIVWYEVNTETWTISEFY